MVIASSCRMPIGEAKHRANRGQPNQLGERAQSVSHQPITAAGMQRKESVTNSRYRDTNCTHYIPEAAAVHCGLPGSENRDTASWLALVQLRHTPNKIVIETSLLPTS